MYSISAGVRAGPKACLAILLLAGGLAGHPARAQTGVVAEDLVFRLIGCEARPESSPYCTDPEIRQLAEDWVSMLVSRDDTKRDPMMALASNMQGLRRKVVACAQDTDCIRQAVLDATATLGDFAENPMLQEEREREERRQARAEKREEERRVAAAEVAERVERERREAQAREAARRQAQTEAALARLRAIDEKYAQEWASSQDQLAPYPEALAKFEREVAPPEEMAARRIEDCHLDGICLARWDHEVIGAIAFMAEVRDRHLAPLLAREMEERRREAEANRKRAEEEALRRQAALQETKEAARRQAAARAAQRRAEQLARIDIDAIIPKGSLLRLLIDGSFEDLDRRLKEKPDGEIDNFTRSLMAAFGGPEFAAALNEKYVANRRNIMAASYAMTRYELLGPCGDEVVRMILREVPATVTRNVYGGIVDRSPGYVVRGDVLQKFAPFVRRSGMQGSTGEFAREIRALGGCANPLRYVIEENLIAFAEWRPFEPWQ